MKIGDILLTAEELDAVPDETVLLDSLEIDVYQAVRRYPISEYDTHPGNLWTWIGRNSDYEDKWSSVEMVARNAPGFRVLWVPGQ